MGMDGPRENFPSVFDRQVLQFASSIKNDRCVPDRGTIKTELSSEENPGTNGATFSSGADFLELAERFDNKDFLCRNLTSFQAGSIHCCKEKYSYLAKLWKLANLINCVLDNSNSSSSSETSTLANT